MSPRHRESLSRSVDDFMEGMGEQIGRAAASAARGLQQATAAAAAASHDGKLTEHAEEIVKRLERGAGSLASSASQGFQRIGNGVREESQHIREQAEETPAPESKVEQAEDKVKRVGHKIGELAGAASHGVRRVVARAREEYEDIRAEADVKRVADGVTPSDRS